MNKNPGQVRPTARQTQVATQPTPPGGRRFGWYSVAWAGWAAGFVVIEGLGIRANTRGGREDWQHRTLTENVRYLAATDRDGPTAPFRVWRRIGLLTGLSWISVHFVTNGSFV